MMLGAFLSIQHDRIRRQLWQDVRSALPKPEKPAKSTRQRHGQAMYHRGCRCEVCVKGREAALARWRWTQAQLYPKATARREANRRASVAYQLRRKGEAA